MNVEFYQCKIEVNNSKIMADSVVVNENANLAPNYVLGNAFPLWISPNAGLNHNIQISYYLEPANEPCFAIVTGLKAYGNKAGTLSSATLNIAGNTITGYLTNYSLNVVFNEPVMASVTFVSYHELTGTIKEQSDADSLLYNLSGMSGVAHGRYVTTQGMLPHSNILEFNYNFKASWIPNYIIGKKDPYLIRFDSAQENAVLVNDIGPPSLTTIHPQFSGQKATQEFSSHTGIYIHPFVYNSASYILIPLQDMRMVSNRNDINTNNIITNTTEFINFY